MRRIATLVLFSTLAVSACSTVGEVTPLAGTSFTPIPQAATWSLAVNGCNQATECDDLRSAVVGRLVGLNLAERVVAAGQPAQVGLTVDVSRTRSVSGAERIFFGALAGRNEVEANVMARDLRGPAPVTLRQFTVKSGSAAHPFSGETGSQDAYRRFASDIADGLRR